MFIVTHDSFFANTKQFCHMHFLSRSNREVKDTQGSEGRFIFSPLEHLKPSMSTDPVQDPCIAGTGALCNLQSFRCPQHLRCCRSQRRIGISVANRPPPPPGPSVFIDHLVAGKVWCYLPQIPDDKRDDGETSLC